MRVELSKQMQLPSEPSTVSKMKAVDPTIPVRSSSMNEIPLMPVSAQEKSVNKGAQPMDTNATQGHHDRPLDNHSQQVESSGDIVSEKKNESITESLVTEASPT
ncbi:unnamed protein product [Linum trigynum]|uniref:Uncharacterized protein n=1 Tax=Linum trigynum TaxID=586398 RepID=A0AAV2CAM5_9ROSI